MVSKAARKIKTTFKQKTFLAFLGLCIFAVVLEMSLRSSGAVYFILQNRHNDLQGDYRILCVGESTTAFGGRNSYPALLEYQLNQKYPDTTFSVINKGRPAQHTGDLLYHLKGDIEKYHPDVVVFMAGINDAMRYKGSSAGRSLSEIDSFKLFLIDNIRIVRLVNLIKIHLDVKLRGSKKGPRVNGKQDDKVEESDEDVPNKDDLYIALKEYHPKTALRINKMVSLAFDRGAKVVVMQYPTRDITALKDVIGRGDEVIFVENKLNFEKALEISAWEDIFEDRFAGNFGHCTREGNLLIASNLAQALEGMIKK